MLFNAWLMKRKLKGPMIKRTLWHSYKNVDKQINMEKTFNIQNYTNK